MKLKEFIKECNEKEVFKKLSIYVVTSWVLLQVADVLTDPLGLPDESISILIVILIIGFPLNVFLVWKFHLAPMEHRKMKLDSNNNFMNDTDKMSVFQKFYYISIVLFSIVAIGISSLIINKKFYQNAQLDVTSPSDKIAVMKFGNNTGNKDFDIVGKMAVDWIIHGITENGAGKVIKPSTIDEYSKILKASITGKDSRLMIRDYFKPGKVISGNFYLQNEKLLFQGSIQDYHKNDELISFKLVECDSDDPLDCIENLKQIILGYLITNENNVLNYQASPPKFEAYQLMLTALDNYNDLEKYISYMDKAIEIDSNFFEPKVHRVGFYYNEGEYEKADSLLKEIIPDQKNKSRQQNLLNLYDALLKGQNDKAYHYMTNEYNQVPFDLASNSSTMVLALQFVNKPLDVDPIFMEISMDSMDFVKCEYCEYRSYIKAFSDIELGKYSSAKTLLKDALKFIDGSTYLNDPFIIAIVRNGDRLEEEDFILKLEITEPIEEWREICLIAGKEYLLKKDKQHADRYFDKIIASYKGYDHDASYGFALYYKGEFEKSERIFEKLLIIEPENIEILSVLAVSYFKNGKNQKADKAVEQIEALRKQHRFGETDYAIAQYYASRGEKEEALKFLLKAVSQGSFYKQDTFQNDPHFLAYTEDQFFKNILNFWH